MKKCFVISPIGAEGTDTRKRSDQVLKHIIKPAATECGYDANRADEISEPGIITSQVIQRIVDDQLVIADLTERNPNVFYELALRHALRKPLVQIIKKGEQIPFDVAGMRTIPVDHKDLDSVEEAKLEIIKQIKAVENKSSSEIETPISVSLELQALKQSENPEERSLADLVSTISEIRASINNIEKRFEDPFGIIPPHLLDQIIKKGAFNKSPVSPRLIQNLEFMTEDLLKISSEKRYTADDKEKLNMIAKEMNFILREFRHREID